MKTDYYPEYPSIILIVLKYVNAQKLCNINVEIVTNKEMPFMNGEFTGSQLLVSSWESAQ